MAASDDFEETVRRAASQIEATAKAAEARLEPFDEKLNRLPLPSSAQVRFHLTQWIVWSFIFYAVVVGGFIMFSEEKDKFTILLEILKTIFLPLVTLVIGHYFGSRSE
jgi:hypothetical protein